MYTFLRWNFFIVLGLFFLVSCQSVALAPKAGSPVSDKELNAAIEQARSTMDTLLHAMLAPKPSYDFLGVKVRFSTQDGGYDDNWVEPVDYYNGIFTIRMMDGLTYNTNLHVDHTLDVSAKKVVDWMIVEKDGTLIGGYTIRLAYEHMTSDEKKEFLRVTGYKLK
ncbi:MAG TPA: DUF2314 domain-containing protein [Anaerolineales bacterium]|nr:DUF2314 domain-containing protein [Anaerolineales bacterium]